MIKAASKDDDSIPGLVENFFLAEMHEDLKASVCFVVGVCGCCHGCLFSIIC